MVRPDKAVAVAGIAAVVVVVVVVVAAEVVLVVRAGVASWEGSGACGVVGWLVTSVDSAQPVVVRWQATRGPGILAKRLGSAIASVLRWLRNEQFSLAYAE